MKKVRYGGRVVSMAILIVCGVNIQGRREVLAIEPMLEESKGTYSQLFEGLKARGLQTPSLVVSDAHGGLVAAIRAGFPRCFLAAVQGAFHAKYPRPYLPPRQKGVCRAAQGDLACPSAEGARVRATALAQKYAAQYPKAIETLENGLEDSLSFYAFPKLDARRIASTNMLERLNEEIRRRTKVVGIFPNPESYVRLVTTFLMEYADDWSVSRAYLSEESIRTLFPQVA